MEQFIIILCYTTYKIMRSHFKVISVLCYFPSDRYFMYFLMKFFFVVLSSLSRSCSLEFSTNYLSMCCLKKPDFCISLGKKFFGHNCPERFSCFWHLYKFCHKNSKIFLGTTAFHYQNGMQYVTCIVTTLRTVILVMYYKITRSLGSYTFYVFLFLFPMGLEKWSNRPASEKKESLFFGSWRKR